jgi:hypothetical protein
MRPESGNIDFSPNRDAREVRATTGRALMHSRLPKRTEDDDPKRAAFVNRLVHERRIFGGARGPNLKVIRF